MSSKLTLPSLINKEGQDLTQSSVFGAKEMIGQDLYLPEHSEG